MSDAQRKIWTCVAVVAALMLAFPTWNEVGRHRDSGIKVIDEPRGVSFIGSPPRPHDQRCVVEMNGARLAIQLIILGLVGVVAHNVAYRKELESPPEQARDER